MDEKKRIALKKIQDGVLKDGFNSDFITLIKMIGDITNKVINKPTSIEKVFPLSYLLNKNSINDVYSTVEQKLSSYKKEDLSFELRIHYDDKTFEKFPTIKSFLESHETQPKCAQSISMTWNARLFFEGRTNPLVQKIGEQHKLQITFSTPPSIPEDTDRVFYIFNEQQIEGFGVVHVTIQHSNKIWAVEIIKHIEDFLSRIEIRNTGLRNFLFKYRTKIGKIAELIVDLSPVIPLIIILNIVLNNSVVIPSKIIVNSVFSFIFFVFSSISSNTIGRYLYKSLSKLRPRSMIVINEYSENLCKQKQITKSLVFQIILLIIIPMVINIISAWLSVKFGIK